MFLQGDSASGARFGEAVSVTSDFTTVLFFRIVYFYSSSYSVVSYTPWRKMPGGGGINFDPRKWGTALWTLFQPPATFSFFMRFSSGFRCLRGFVLSVAGTPFNSGFDLARIEEVAVKTGVFSFPFALVTTFWTLFFHLDTFCYGETLC